MCELESAQEWKSCPKTFVPVMIVDTVPKKIHVFKHGNS